MLNRYVSMDKTYIEMANLMNVLGTQDPRLHFDFYFNILTKSKKFIKYIGKNKNAEKVDVDLLKTLSTHYKVSVNTMKEYMSLLTKEQIKEIKQQFATKGDKL